MRPRTRTLWPFTLRGTGAIVLAIACLVFAGELGVPALLYFGIFLLVAVAASLVSLYTVRIGPTVTRSMSHEVAAVGSTATVEVRVDVRAAFPSSPGSWRDVLPTAFSGRAEGVFPALGSGFVGSDGVVELAYAVTGIHRGVHALGPLTITTRDPFGFTRRTRIVGGRTPVTVVPAVVDLSPLVSSAGEAGSTLQTSTSHIGQGTDNLIPRPYEPGDSMRRIHWRATAHRDSLMVRQEEQESTPEATVVLDLGGLRWETEAGVKPGVDPGFETAITAAVSTAARLLREGYAVEVIGSDGAEITEPLDSESDLDELLVRCATLTTARDDHLEDLPRLVAAVTTGPLVLITGRFDPADAEMLAPVPHHSALPVLFAVAPVGDALERAERTGWRTATLAPDGDLAAAWEQTAERGVSRVFG